MKQHNLLMINDIFKYEIAVLMFRFHNCFLPSAFDPIFQSKFALITTRSNSRVIPMSCRSAVSQQSIRYIGPTTWNNIPLPVRALFLNQGCLRETFLGGAGLMNIAVFVGHGSVAGGASTCCKLE